MADTGLLGGDLGSILSQMQAYSQPTPEEQAAARRQQLAIMFASLVGAPKGMEWDRLGQGSLLGMQARGQALGGAADNRRKAMQDAAAALQLQNALQGQRSAQQERQIWAGAGGAPSAPAPVSGPPAAFQAPGGASALMGGAMGGATPPTANLPTQTAAPSSTRDAMRAYLQSVIANAQKAGRGDIVQAASQQLLKLEPPPDEVFKVDYANDASGKPTTFVVFKSGRSATIPGIVPREKIDYLNTGGAFLPKGEYSGVIPGAAPIPATMTPGEIASNQVARGNLSVAQQRLGLERQNAQRQKFSQVAGSVNGQPAYALFDSGSGQFLDPNTKQPLPNFAPVEGAGQVLPTAEGYSRITPSNQVKPIFDASGNRVMPQPAATIQERMAANDAALSNVNLALTLARKNPDAFGVKNVAPDIAVQRLDPKGVQARAVVSGIAGQKFHDLSGAAVSVTEAQRLKPYIPNMTDPGDVVITKLENLAREYATMNQELANGRPLAEVISQPASGKASKPTREQAIEELRRRGVHIQ